MITRPCIECGSPSTYWTVCTKCLLRKYITIYPRSQQQASDRDESGAIIRCMTILALSKQDG